MYNAFSLVLRSLLIKRNGCVVLCGLEAAVTSAPTRYAAPAVPPGPPLQPGAKRGRRRRRHCRAARHGTQVTPQAHKQLPRPCLIWAPSASPERFAESHGARARLRLSSFIQEEDDDI